jgi:hypothetical protein
MAMGNWWSTDAVGDEMAAIERGIDKVVSAEDKRRADYEANLARTNRVGREQERRDGGR